MAAHDVLLGEELMYGFEKDVESVVMYPVAGVGHDYDLGVSE